MNWYGRCGIAGTPGVPECEFPDTGQPGGAERADPQPAVPVGIGGPPDESGQYE